MTLSLKDYSYELPESRIAKYPPKERGHSKLLIYKNSKIEHNTFNDITEALPKDATLVFNDTKVIPARIVLYKETGARIEIFFWSL